MGNCVIDFHTGDVFCKNCLEMLPLPTGMINPWFKGIINLYDKCHKNCKPGTVRETNLCRFQGIPDKRHILDEG